MTSNFSPFDKISTENVGRLMEINESYETGYSCKIWFDYTRNLYNEIKEGSFVVIKNFKIPKSNKEDCYSILKIIKKLPSHYASVERLERGYPAFSEESIRGVRDSFIDQVSESFEDLTKIVVSAIPTTFQVCIGENIDSIDKIIIDPDDSLPILGEDVKILHKEVIEKIINMNLNIKNDNIIEIAHFKDNEDIKIFLDIERCLKTHFGIFGFTGVGKTNLLSTFISKMFEKERLKKKVLFFDIMDEYLGLLIDLFFKKNLNAYLIFLSVYDLSTDIKQFFFNKTIPSGLVEKFYSQMVLPKDLKSQNLKPKFCKCIERLFIEKKIRIFGEKNRIIDWLDKIIDNFIKTINIKNADIFKKDLIKFFSFVLKGEIKIHEDEMNPNIKKLFYTELNKRINQGKLIKEPKNKSKEPSKQITQFTKDLSSEKGPTFFFHKYFRREAWITSLNVFLNFLDKSQVIEYKKYSDFLIDENDIIKEIHSNDNNTLFIFTSSKESDVRSFLNKIGTIIYEKRKNEGIIEPLATLIFDEADTFIPQENKDDSVIESKKMVEEISRRGRKFGLGIGLATQRITFLETNILAQLHTYFISRLPRKSDRDRIKEAFSLSDEEFEATLKFIKGNWLLVSHEGLGLEGVPLSIKVENANDRVKEFLEKF